MSILQKRYETDFAEIKIFVEKFKLRLHDNGIELPPKSAIFRLLEILRKIKEKSSVFNCSDEDWRKDLIKSYYCLWVVQAIDEALDDPKAINTIKSVIGGSLELGSRICYENDNNKELGKQKYKSFLWELDLYRRLKKSNIAVRFEEPDLVASLGNDLDFSIACKKVYRRKNEKEEIVDHPKSVVKSGCDQIKIHKRPGILAINIDDLTEKDFIFKAININDAQKYIKERIKSYIENHRSCLEKADGKYNCCGVLISLKMLFEINGKIETCNNIMILYTSMKRKDVKRLEMFIDALDSCFYT